MNNAPFTWARYLTPNMIVGFAALIALLLMMPLFRPFAYPFRLLNTIVHELGHGVASILTGGRFIRFEIMPSGEGTAYTMGGWRAFIIQAGYLGAALFGAILIVVGKNPNWSRLIMIFLGVLLLIAAIFYGVPTIFSTQIQIGLLTTLSSILFGGLLLWASTHVTDLWVLFSINLIAFQLSFNVFIDVFVLVIVATRIRYMPANDALSMARLTGLPPLFWALLWTLLTFLVLGGALWVAWTRE